jgi:hypothetical protein
MQSATADSALRTADRPGGRCTARRQPQPLRPPPGRPVRWSRGWQITQALPPGRAWPGCPACRRPPRPAAPPPAAGPSSWFRRPTCLHPPRQLAHRLGHQLPAGSATGAHTRTLLTTRIHSNRLAPPNGVPAGQQTPLSSSGCRPTNWPGYSKTSLIAPTRRTIIWGVASSTRGHGKAWTRPGRTGEVDSGRCSGQGPHP